MKWTSDQRAAIEARGENLLLAAAAGSGKTTVLVERVATMLQEGADIREMLIVTFTRAAAADMRASLIRRLTALAAEDLRFRQQAEYAEYASISTIHSFCTDLLRSFFQAAGVDPAFRIADGPEESVLRAKALDCAMNQAYAADSADHRALVSGRTPEEVMELSLRLYSFLMERPDPWNWLDERIAGLEAGEDRFTPALCHAAQRALTDAKSIAEYALDMTLRCAALEPFEKTAREDLEILESMERLPYTPLRAALKKPGFPRKPPARGALKDDPDHAVYDQLRKQMKKITEDAADCLPLELDDALSDLPACARELRGLREIVKVLDAEYTRLKDEKSLLTFADLERRTLEVLRNDEVLSAVREKYAFVFVDEYQDVSDIQEAILSRVAREGCMFSVGDVKQSIYRFRHAEPTLFMHKYDAYRENRGGRLIVLNQNFRSRATVLNYTNAVFSRAMQGGDSEIVYDSAAALYPGADYPGEDSPVELHLIDKDEKYDDLVDSESARIIGEMKDAEAEALLAARRMKELRGQLIWDGKKGEYRPLQWRDFVILTRQARDVAQQILSVLRREGVPAYADVSGGYLDVMEVQVALALLRLVENRRRDPEWIAVLRAPNVGLSSRQLADIRARFPEVSFSEAVVSYAALGAAEGGNLAVRLRGLIHKLDQWRSLSQAVPLSQLIFTVLNESGFYPVCGALPGGSQRQANLDILSDRAASYEASHAGGLTGFLTYIEDMHSVSEDMGEAHVLGENDDVVRIMTVHKSKGLEFPVVFGILLGRKLGGGGHRGEFCAHREVGVGLKHMDESLGTCREALPRLAVRALADAEADAEELRILYVLLTRARDRLILIGSVNSLDKAITRYRMSNIRLLRPACYLDLLVPPMLDLPGGEDLSEKNTSPDPALPHVDVRLTSRAQLMLQEEEESGASIRLFEEACAAEPDDELLSTYTWQYPHEDAVLLPLKLTASGISREITGPAQPPELIPRPQFMLEEGEMTGAERGTATHAALQGLDLAALKGLSGDMLHQAVVLQLNDMTACGALTAAMREAVRPAVLLRFLESELGRRMLASGRIQREWMFTLRMSTEEALGIPSEEDLLVQGAVDLCFEEDGGWILVDYKTDRAKDVPALIERYRPQLLLYAKALERITGQPVHEIWLCLLAADKGFYRIEEA